MTNGGLLRKAAMLAPGLTAVVDGNRRLTFGELFARSCRLVGALSALGVERQDRVAVLGPNSPRTMEVITGLALGGLVRVHLHYGNTMEQHVRMVRDSGARVVIADGCSALEMLGHPQIVADSVTVISEDGSCGLDYEDLLAEASDTDGAWPVTEEDIALLGYTGGTTGESTATVQTHGRWFAHTVENLAVFPPLDDADVYLVATALAGAPSTYVFPAIARLCRTVVAPQFDALTILETIERCGATFTVMLPGMLNELVTHPRSSEFDLSSLRAIFVVGTPMAETTLRAATARLGDVVYFGYGQSECAPVAVLTPRDVRRGLDKDARILRSVGRVAPRGDIRIVDESGSALPLGQVGEAQIRAAGTMRGYWGADAASKFTADGWVRSGDVGRVDPDGYVFILGRYDDRIVLPDHTVYPSVVEDLLHQDNSVAEVVVTTGRDDQEPRTLTVLMYPQVGAEPAEVAARALATLEGQGLIAQVHLTYEPFAKSPAGKILRRAVRIPGEPTNDSPLTGAGVQLADSSTTSGASVPSDTRHDPVPPYSERSGHSGG